MHPSSNKKTKSPKDQNTKKKQKKKENKTCRSPLASWRSLTDAELEHKEPKID